MNVGDREHLEKLLETHRRRLNVLEEQIAFFGVGYAPPHLLVERQDLQNAISELQAQLRGVLPDQARDLLSSSTRSIDQRTIRDTLEPIPSATNFIGRTSDLAAYREKLHRDRLIIIKGMSGVGKTTLGAKLAREEAEDEDHIFWLTFDRVEKNTADALFWALAAFLASRGQPDLWRYLEGELGAQRPLDRTVKLNLLRAGLSTGEYVLCFDDFQIVNDAPDIALFFRIIQQRFLAQLKSRYIIMGREIPPQMEYLVSTFLEGFTEEETRAFIEAQGLRLPPALVRRLWQRTEGNAKLLELSASALVPLEDNPRSVRAFVDAMASREGDVRDYLMAEIYNGLQPGDRRIISVLSIFPAPVERDLLEVILSAVGIADIGSRIDALANTLIVSETEDGRIHCHSLVQEYAYHALSHRDRDLFHRQAANYYDLNGNYLAAAHHHFARGDREDSLNILLAHARDIVNIGGAGSLLEQLSRYEKQSLNLDRWVSLGRISGDVHQMRGEYRQAVEAYETALQETAHEVVRAELLHKIGSTYEKSGQYDIAMEYFTKSLTLSKALGDQALLAEVHRAMGWVHYRQEHLEEARACFVVSLMIGQTLGEKLPLAWTGLRLGVIDWEEGKLEEARAHFLESRRIFRDFGDRQGEAMAVFNLGLVYHEIRETDQELSYYQQAVEILEQIGDVDKLHVAYNNLGYLYYQRGDHETAIRYYERLANLAQNTEHRRMLSRAFAGLADAYLAQNKLQQALKYAQDAQGEALQIGAGPESGFSWCVLGAVWLALGNAAEARSCFEQSIPLLEEAQEDEDLSRAREGLSTALSRLGSAAAHHEESDDHGSGGS